MADLAQKSCVPCRSGAPPLSGAELERLQQQLPAWTVQRGHELQRDYRFPDFASALAFVNQIGAIAEQEGHHPDIELGWGHVGVRTFTHKIDGLTESDFILAAKIEQAHAGLVR